MANDNVVSKKQSKNGFRIQRRTPRLESPRDLPADLKRNFPTAQLTMFSGKSLRLVSSTESASMLIESDILTSMTLNGVREQVLARTKDVPRHHAELVIARVVPAKILHGLGIGVLLDDKDGLMRAERDAYLQAIADIAEVPAPELKYTPDITLCKVRGSVEAKNFAFEAISKTLVGASVLLLPSDIVMPTSAQA